MTHQSPFGRLAAWAWMPVLALVCLVLASCQTMEKSADQSDPAPPDALTRWTLLADYLGGGFANWRTLAIMQPAMHDALNAAQPVYVRWFPPERDEPPPAGADPRVAMAAAARDVLARLHPNDLAVIDRTWRAALAQAPDGAGKEAGVKLGAAIGQAAIRRRDNDGWTANRSFAVSNERGRWRPTPPLLLNTTVNSTRPFLFRAFDELPVPPPPALDSPEHLRDLEDTRRVGGASGAARTPAQTAAAFFWARQSSQRGFLRAGLNMLAKYPRPGGLHEHARFLSQMFPAFADSAIIVWRNKEKWAYWRPVTEIADRGLEKDWQPLIPTPAFPEYPSGHAADCFVGAFMLRAAFPEVRDPFVFVSLASSGNLRRPDGSAFGMGQHAHGGAFDDDAQTYPSPLAAAEECSRSRVWAGAHFQGSDEESRHIATEIAKRAVAAVPALGQGRKP